MARLSDMIRRGESALRRNNSGSAEAPEKERSEAPEADDQASGEPGVVPRTEQPPQVGLKDFPVLSQIYNEVGTVATVVDQINRITDFIEAFAAGEELPPRQTPERAPAPAAPPQEPTAAAAEPPRPTPERAAPPKPAEVAKPAAAAEATDEQIEELYHQLYAFLKELMQAVQEERPFTLDQAFALVSRIVDIPNATDILYRRAIYARETDTSHGFASAVVLHSVNVAVYADKIGEGLGYNRDQLIDLGVAALVHDMGMVILPPDFYSKTELSPEDIEVLHQHPVRAHNTVAQLGETYKWLAEILLQEHEREDGSGYPQGLSGNQIHEYAKIIGVADAYAGLTRSRPERRGLLPFEAVKKILQTQKAKFDSRVVRILLGKLSAFPIGSLVKLNSGAIGKVVETDEAYPLRPVLRIVFDAQGRRVDEERVIPLREYPILHISDAIYEEDLQQA